MVPNEVRTGTGLGQRSTKACRLTSRRGSVLRAEGSVDKEGGFMANSLKVWHIIPLRFVTLLECDEPLNSALAKARATLTQKHGHQQVKPGF